MEIIDALLTNEFNAAVVESLVGSIDDVVEMIDAFVRDSEVEFVGKIIGELEGAGVVAAVNVTEGSIAAIGVSVGSMVESSLHVVLNVVKIAIGSSVIIL